MRQKDDMEAHVSKRSEGRSGRKSASNHAKAELARLLKQAYGPAPSDPIPSRWMDLLDQLEEAQLQRSGKPAKESGS